MSKHLSPYAGALLSLLAASACGTPGAARDAYLRACLRWLVDGCRAYRREGLGIPDFATPDMEPEGLSGWFDSALECGRLELGRGWTPFPELLADCVAWHHARGAQEPSGTALGRFLGTRLAARRDLVAGHKVRLYQARFVDTVGQG